MAAPLVLSKSIRPRAFFTRLLLAFPALAFFASTYVYHVGRQVGPGAGTLRALPLFDVAQELIMSLPETLRGLAPEVSLLSLIAFCFPKHGWLFGALAVLTALDIVLFYSTLGAFVQVLALGAAFLFCYPRLTNRADTARLTLAIIFIFGALHKLNTAYFDGCEFRAGGDFYNGALSIWMPLLEQLSYYQVFLFTTIGLELLIGALLCCRGKLGLFAAALFGPVIGIFHPGAGVVTLYFALFIFAARPDVAVRAYRLCLRGRGATLAGYAALLATPFFILGWESRANALAVLALIPSLVIIAAIASAKGPWLSTPSRPRASSWLAFALLFAILPTLRLSPTPLGFSMFSGRGCASAAAHQMKIGNPEDCIKLARTFSLRLWESKLNWEPSKLVCSVTAPSASSMLLLKRTLNATPEKTLLPLRTEESSTD